MKARMSKGKAIQKITMLLLAAMSMSLVSCIPQKYVTLMQDQNGDGATEFAALDSITNRYKLNVNDYLYVRVKSPDEKLSEPFNITSGNSMNMGGSQNSTFYYYLIDDNMDIDMPIVGKVNLKGCNIEQAKGVIYNAVSEYLKDFTLTVKLATNSFTILGEVGSQGVKKMDRDQITVYDALAMSGGFSTYAKRKEVKLLRKDEQGRQHMYTLDLTDENIINSDFYYIYPNDVLYVRPMKVKMLGFGETFSLGLITSLITFYLLINSLL